MALPLPTRQQLAQPGVDLGRRAAAAAAAEKKLPAASAAAAAGATAATGTLAGAFALITGNTIGAGMLALPAVTAPAGLLPTACGLCGTWGLLTLNALLLAEVNLAVMADRQAAKAAAAAAACGAGSDAAPQQEGGDGIITLRQMAVATLGPSGKGGKHLRSQAAQQRLREKSENALAGPNPHP